MDNRNKRFMELLAGLEAVEFIGLCKFLGVKLVEEKSDPAPSTPEPRDFTDLFGDLMEKFSNLSRSRQRELIKILKKVNK